MEFLALKKLVIYLRINQKNTSWRQDPLKVIIL